MRTKFVTKAVEKRNTGDASLYKNTIFKWNLNKQDVRVYNEDRVQWRTMKKLRIYFTKFEKHQMSERFSRSIFLHWVRLHETGCIHIHGRVETLRGHLM